MSTIAWTVPGFPGGAEISKGARRAARLLLALGELLAFAWCLHAASEVRRARRAR
jgi:hypothetical protein